MSNAKTVNKKEFVRRIAEESGLTQKNAEAFIEAQIEVTTNALINGEKLDVRGLLIADTKDIEAGKGRNPKTKEETDISAHKRASMKLSPIIRKKVKEATTK